MQVRVLPLQPPRVRWRKFQSGFMRHAGGCKSHTRNHHRHADHRLGHRPVPRRDRRGHRLPSSNGQDTRLSIWGCGFESRWGRHHHACGHPAGRDLRSKRSARWFDSTMRVHFGHPSGMRRARGAQGRQRRSARRGAGPPDGRHAEMAMHRFCNPERPVRFRGRPPPIRTRKDKPTGDGSGLENRRAMSLGGSTPPPSANRPIPTRVWAIVFCTVPTCDGHV